MTKRLALAGIAFCLAIPLGAQEPARDALRELTWEEEDDRVLAHLLTLLPQARDTAQFEAVFDRWIGSLNPADTTNVRHRIDQLLWETPETELYGTLLILVQHRFEREAYREGEPSMPTTAMSAAYDEEDPGRDDPESSDGEDGDDEDGDDEPHPDAGSGLPDPNPLPTKPSGVGAPPSPPVASWQIIGRVGSQLWSARGDCSRLQELQAELSAATCTPGTIYQQQSCKTSRSLVYGRANQLLQEANC